MELVELFLNKQASVKKWIEDVLGYEIENEDFWEQMKTGEDLCRLMLKINEG